MQIKSTMRYHLMPVRMATVQRQEICIGENVEKREPLCTIGRNVNWCIHCGNSFEENQNYHMTHMVRTSGYISKGNEITILKRYLLPHAH